MRLLLEMKLLLGPVISPANTKVGDDTIKALHSEEMKLKAFFILNKVNMFGESR